MFRLIFRSYSKETMVRILNVAEKNDAAKSLASIMSGGTFRRREGLSKFNKIYEFDYQILNQNSTMIMTSVSGHLLNYEFNGQYRKWHGCSPVSLFDAPVMKSCPQNYVDIKRTLEREVRGCKTLIIWTDGDREGENIGFEIIQVCQAVKPNIRVLRARFSEITPGAIQRACHNLIPPDKNTSDAVDVRQMLDLRIGAAFTRFQTLRLQKIFPNVLADQLISYGSCQFPTLGFVVERYKQVQKFVPEPFWKIQVTHESEDGLVDFNWQRISECSRRMVVELHKAPLSQILKPSGALWGRLFDHTACLVLYQHCLQSPEAEVVSVKTKPKSKWRPLALDTVELEKLASRKLKISAKETMKIAEKLYTQGFISYPRTETNQFPKDFNLANLVQQQMQDQRWGEFAGRIMAGGGPTPRNGNKSDKAHPPIHPTKYTNTLQGNEGRIYEFVVRHFLACCHKDAQGMETTVEIEIAEEKFSAQGLMITARNYLDVYPYDRWNAKVIPVYEEGQQFQPKVLEMNQGETSPPSLLTEADLIALMDKHGIGTDATHAEHIETIKSRLYVGVRQDGKLVPGELGMGLVEGYDAMGYEMSKPHLRAELEADLKSICLGQKDCNDVLAIQVQKYKEVFLEAMTQAGKIDEALAQYFGDAQPFHQTTMPVDTAGPVRPCPRCGQPIVLRVKKDGKGYFLSCMGFPDCRVAQWFPDSVLEAAVSDETCSQCHPGPVKKIKFKFKKGSVPPYIPLQHVGCVGGCDRDLWNILQLRDIASPVSRPTGTVQATTKNSQRGNMSTDSGVGSSFSSSQSSREFSTQASTQRTSLGASNQPGLMGLTNQRPNSWPPGGQGRGKRNSFNGRPDQGAAGQAIVCTCGEDANLLTVRKEGPNTGRQFYACIKPPASKCDFFLWVDESLSPDDGGRGGTGGLGGYSRDPSNQQRFGVTTASSGDQVCCKCGQPAKALTVNKPGANQGRLFYGCSKPMGQGCGFFEWGGEDEDRGGGGGGGGGARRGGPRGFASSQPPSRLSGGGQGSSNGTCCGCGELAKSLTVNKAGSNQGRPFFACAKPMGQGCGFFQWGDEDGNSGPPGGRQGYPASGQDKNNKNSSGNTGQKRKRRCGACGEQGHNRKNCPNI